MKDLDIIRQIDHIESIGKDYEIYRVYFKNGKTKDLTESQFYAEDTYYNGELALKVIN